MASPGHNELKHIEAWTKCGPFCRWQFQMQVFLSENDWISNEILLKHVPGGPVDNKLAYVQASMCWHYFQHQRQYNVNLTWWRHRMETFSTLLALCVGNSPVPGEFAAQRQVTRSFDVFFDLRPNKWLSKQSWGWWFKMSSRPLWRHCNERKIISFAC